MTMAFALAAGVLAGRLGHTREHLVEQNCRGWLSTRCGFAIGLRAQSIQRCLGKASPGGCRSGPRRARRRGDERQDPAGQRCVRPRVYSPPCPSCPKSKTAVRELRAHLPGRWSHAGGASPDGGRSVSRRGSARRCRALKRRAGRRARRTHRRGKAIIVIWCEGDQGATDSRAVHLRHDGASGVEGSAQSACDPVRCRTLHARWAVHGRAELRPRSSRGASGSCAGGCSAEAV